MRSAASGEATAPSPIRLGAIDAGRLVAASFVCMYLFVVAVGGRPTWERLRVPVEQPAFLDMRSLTSAWECDRRGVDVIPVNPCDPRERPANYPSLWLIPAPLGLGASATVPLGIALALLFFVSALLVSGPLTLREGVLYGIALCSPAVMFGVERGNPDLFIFVLLAAAVVAIQRPGRVRIVGYGLVVVATLLKFFPGFAWTMVVRRSIASACAMAAIVTPYAALAFTEIRTILEVVPDDIVFSYGAGVLADGLVLALDPPGGLSSTAVYLVLAGGALLAVVFGARWRRRSPAPPPPSRKLDAFWAGAGIYVGSYAVMHNYDYRMVFLLLAMPQLMAWSGRPRSPVPATWILAGLMISLLLAARPVYDLATEEVVNWLLFVGLGAALVATALPRREVA